MGTALLAVRHDAYISFARHNNPHAMNPCLCCLYHRNELFNKRHDPIISYLPVKTSNVHRHNFLLILFVQVAEGIPWVADVVNKVTPRCNKKISKVKIEKVWH